ncbi:RNA 2',3'-cyclic phosphodiesterase [Streptomyces sp. NPDC008313]|uniref:RNA 2',3'-cyclic phosphodiesterase n=1 Tax=Streptomyces sp. NPDC008313 TaxID=3364826 RepID=UPI0036EE9632
MRLFAAVLPPEEAVRELAPVVDGLRRLRGADALRWTGRPGWHFTLAFYGEVDEETVPDLSRRLARAAAHTPLFPLALSGGGHFGDRALWAGAAGDLRTMRLLADRAETAGRKAGVDSGGHRRYRPHLTLARSRLATDLRPFAAALAPFAGREWTAGALCLVRSELPRSGVPGELPHYDTVERWELGAGE